MAEFNQINFSKAATVTPNDGTNLPNPILFYVGGAGNVRVDTAGGDTVTFNSVPAGTLLPVLVRRIYSTGTTATNIVAVF